ncbi:hypothetical protein RclHR1_09610011 [Rhizophagus clarus]|uniref:Uncharacterized protein n=1 Tax=Rhizophagus clarus TaxID=94130 RepID=A0A2Z6S509_9GLOM|nr:hypothetical protein RclHR1_09610011 [Rhizophagus clarus]
MSEQNLLSAFQAEFLLKILARLHILKVWNTKHTVSDSILKIWNFFRGGLVWNLETDWYFEGSDVPFRRLDSIQRVTIFENHLKSSGRPEYFKGLCFLNANKRWGRIKVQSPWLSRCFLIEFRRSTVFFRSDKIFTFDMFYWIKVKSCLLESNQLEHCLNH